jgi:hypothetical protein
MEQREPLDRARPLEQRRLCKAGPQTVDNRLPLREGAAIDYSVPARRGDLRPGRTPRAYRQSRLQRTLFSLALQIPSPQHTLPDCVVQTPHRVALHPTAYGALKPQQKR